MDRSKRTLIGAGLALVAALVVGCGGGGSPEDTVQEFYDASVDQDGAAACELLTDASAELAAAGGGGDCATAFEEQTAEDVPEDFEIGEVSEDGDSATVEVTSDGESSTVPLTKEDDEWKIDLAGAVAPTGGESG
jgi:hypothetical protein